MSNHSSTYKHLFAPGGDLTEKALLDYAYNRLPTDERTAVEAHLASCAMCSDALDGVLLFASEAAYADALANVKDKVEDKAAPKLHTMHMYRRLAVAASVLLFMGIAFYFVNDQIGEHQDVAMTSSPENKEAEEKTVQEAPVPVTAADSEQAEYSGYDWQNGQASEGVKSDQSSGLVAGTYTVTVTDANGNATREPQKKTESKNADQFERADTTRQWAGYMSTSNAVGEWDKEQKDIYIKADSTFYEAPVTSKPVTGKGKKAEKPSVVQGNTNGTIETQPSGGSAPYTYQWKSADELSKEEDMQDKDVSILEANDKVTSADMAPVYKGGEEMLRKYLAGAGLPSSPTSTDSVKIELNIGAKGRVESVGIGPSKLNKQQVTNLKVYLMKMPAWEPALYNGVAVKSKRIVFIRY